MTNQSMVLVVAVLVGYVLLISVVLYFLPMPWNLVSAAVIALLAVRFIFAMKAAAKIGTKRSTRSAK